MAALEAPGGLNAGIRYINGSVRLQGISGLIWLLARNSLDFDKKKKLLLSGEGMRLLPSRAVITFSIVKFSLRNVFWDNTKWIGNQWLPRSEFTLSSGNEKEGCIYF